MQQKKKTYRQIKEEQAIAKTKREKEQCFAYYDDVKSHTHKVVDW